MLRLILICCAGLVVGPALAQEVSPETVRAGVLRARMAAGQDSHSRSEQFVIHGSPRTGWLPQLGNAPGLVRLERAILAVSAERIKDALLTELMVKDQWRGRIYVELHPARSLDETIVVASVLTDQGWTYRVQLPDAVQRVRLAEVFVGVLLREMANRSSQGACAEIPAWLTEGLARKLILNAPTDLILDPPDQTIRGVSLKDVWRSEAKEDSLKAAHEQMGRQAPLTWEELSWPPDEQFIGEAGESFRNSSQLLVESLLRLDDGRVCLRKFLNELPAHLNWQISFLDAFRGHFATQLDLEKWWALRVVDFTGRDLSRTWAKDVSWLKLDEVVRSSVQIRSAAGELPLRTQVSLQTIITDWDFAQQDKVLREKVQQLLLLRARIAQDFVHLVDDYRQVLSEYLAWREKAGFAHSIRGQATPALQPVVREAVQALNGLDQRRVELLQSLQPVNTLAEGAEETPVNH